ncbi:hypothetical protein [Nitratireductor thuwali]|uniref:Uncharacterized protein n=1 Tax=Nitratireductor thuwali TaxID=2267699 RepID=A0ABY5MUK4_9HYPH|nr:hypothetical protein NTH_04014 [Nitratireductor thuwali]
MKVKLLISRAGAGFVQKVGDVVDVSDAEAKRLFESSPPKAVPVRDDGVEPEKAVKSRRRGK